MLQVYRPAGSRARYKRSVDLIQQQGQLTAAEDQGNQAAAVFDVGDLASWILRLVQQ